ncbi:MAG: hypothetical protein AAAC47_16340 [Pararhizobium sp.]
MAEIIPFPNTSLPNPANFTEPEDNPPCSEAQQLHQMMQAREHMPMIDPIHTRSQVWSVKEAAVVVQIAARTGVRL